MRLPARPRNQLALVAALAALVIACGPFDEDDPTATRPPAPTRQVVVSTFTPTAVVPPAQQTATAGFEATAAAMTATEIALNPPPTPTFANPPAPPGDQLAPPTATLSGSSEPILATLGSYGWVFSDSPPTVAEVTAPIVQFEFEPVAVERGQELTVGFSGNEFRAPPASLEGGVYNFEDNSAFPTGSDGVVGGELAFVVSADPDQRLTLEMDNPRFALDVPPGHYAVRVQGHWPPHPQATSTPIFVTWIFNVIVI